MPKGNDVLALAVAEIGVREDPAGSNKVKYNTWFYGKEVSGSAYPWCMAFVQWCYDRLKIPLPLYTASCGTLLDWYKANQPWCVSTEPVPGCIVIFDLPGTKYTTDHTGIYESRSGGYVTTIDGNTGSTSDANGGAVMRRTRPEKYVKAYIVPEGLVEDEKEVEDVEYRFQTLEEIEKHAKWAAPTVRKLIERKCIQGDGDGLDLSRDMLRLLVINDRAGVYG